MISAARKSGAASKIDASQINEKNINERFCCRCLFVGKITSTYRKLLNDWKILTVVKNNLCYLSNAIAVIENVDRKMLNPCRLPAILHKGRLNGQKT